MIKYEKYLFTFLDYFDVPPDNMGSERAIRNVKVKQKESSQFKPFLWAQDFVTIRSVIDTCLKNNKNIFTSLSCISISETE
jgi:transposase